MYIFNVELLGKVTFSSPCIVEKWCFGIKPSGRVCFIL